jgi:hypothetical protein
VVAIENAKQNAENITKTLDVKLINVKHAKIYNAEILIALQ